MITYLIYAIIALFVLGIINNVMYLIRVKTLLTYLRTNHGDSPKKWDLLPLQLTDISPLRTKELLAFLKSPEYFDDETVKVLKKKVLVHLRAGYAIFGALIICFVLGLLLN